MNPSDSTDNQLTDHEWDYIMSSLKLTGTWKARVISCHVDEDASPRMKTATLGFKSDEALRPSFLVVFQNWGGLYALYRDEVHNNYPKPHVD